MQTSLRFQTSCWYSLRPELATHLPAKGRRKLPLSVAKNYRRYKQPIQARREIADKQTVSVSPSAREHPYSSSLPKPAFLGLGAVAWLCLLAAGSTAVWGWRRLNIKSPVPPDEFLDGGEAPFGQESLDKPDYQAALARTRQAVCVHKAMQFRSQGSPARAMVELRRALQENAIVREPLLNARQEPEPLYELYKMHLQNTDVPAEFSTLLQLREMLAIDTRVAENLEEEALQRVGSFSI